MPRACSVCSHAERPAIDQELADAISYRDIAQHYHVSKSTLVRHALHGTPSAVTVPVRVPVQAPQPCPCMHLDWHALVHDAQQCSEFVQQAQTPEQKLYYMQFFLQRFAALIASAGAMRKV